MATNHHKSQAREFALQFLYQCESEKIFHFSPGHYQEFVNSFDIPVQSRKFMHDLVEGTMSRLAEIDSQITGVAANWNLERMAVTDRTVLRLATFELLESETPPKVVLNEAIDLAKKFGTDKSGPFVNGILDRLAKSLRESTGS